jgi:hypothetical protein
MHLVEDVSHAIEVIALTTDPSVEPDFYGLIRAPSSEPLATAMKGAANTASSTKAAAHSLVILIMVTS